MIASGFVGDLAGLTYGPHLNEGCRRIGLSSWWKDFRQEKTLSK